MVSTPKRLDPAVLADDTALDDAIDALIRKDRRMKRRVREIRRRQRHLQDLTSDEAWTAYLRLEEAVNARLIDLTARAARWGYEEGRKFERRGRR